MKEDIIQSLNSEQKTLFEYLLDEAYARGFTDGQNIDYQ